MLEVWWRILPTRLRLVAPDTATDRWTTLQGSAGWPLKPSNEHVRTHRHTCWETRSVNEREKDNKSTTCHSENCRRSQSWPLTAVTCPQTGRRPKVSKESVDKLVNLRTGVETSWHIIIISADTRLHSSFTALYITTPWHPAISGPQPRPNLVFIFMKVNKSLCQQSVLYISLNTSKVFEYTNFVSTKYLDDP